MEGSDIKYDYDRQAEMVTCTTMINGVKYLFVFHDHYSHWYISLSSGKKRRELDIFEDKVSKSGNGYEVARWCLACIKGFPYDGRIVVGWADSRRKRIYTRFLTPLGFKLTTFQGKQHLVNNKHVLYGKKS